MIVDLLCLVAAALVAWVLWTVWPPGALLWDAFVLMLLALALADGRGLTGRRR